MISPRWSLLLTGRTSWGQHVFAVQRARQRALRRRRAALAYASRKANRRRK